MNTAGLCLAVLFGSLTVLPQKEPEPRLIAQGEYSVMQDGATAKAPLTLDHWFMYLQPDGTFKVDTQIKTVHPPDHAEEHFTFTKAMKRRVYEWVMESRRADKTHSGNIHCDFTDTEARCGGTTLNGRAFSTSLAVKAPYAFMEITDEPYFDFPWSFQAIVWQAERSAKQSTSIAIIVLADGDTENGTVLRSDPMKPFEFRYMGRDTIDIVKQRVNAHKFEAKDPERPEGLLFWFSDSGLLLKMTGVGIDVDTIGLSRYEGPAL